MLKHYTLLYIDDDTKAVKMKTFIKLIDLIDFKRFQVDTIRKAEIKQVDKDGYVWFCEVGDEYESRV